MKKKTLGLGAFLLGAFSKVYADVAPPNIMPETVQPLYGVSPVVKVSRYVIIVTPIVGLIVGIIVLLNKKLGKKAKVIWLVGIVAIVATLMVIANMVMNR